MLSPKGDDSMVEQDTIKLLRECDAGVKMGTASIDDARHFNQFTMQNSQCKIQRIMNY